MLRTSIQGFCEAVIRTAIERGCSRFEWWVLDWNTDAIRFYEHLGAKAMDEWTVFRVDGDALDDLAAKFT